MKILSKEGTAVRETAHRSRRLIKIPAAELKLEDLEIKHQRKVYD